jgi:Flp pilus assembly protein TadD
MIIKRKQAVPTLLASAAILGLSLAGCSSAGLENRPALSAAQAPSLGARVEKALADKDYARALMQAEEMVAAIPDDASYRALLGRAYLANGRYASARTAFNDAVALGNRDPRTIVSLSMAETGLGNAQGARALLFSHIADLPAADYGLAIAMAGNPQEGVRALLEAVKQPEATAQTRQNLAYALALGGAWGQARLVAGQDLSAKDAERRIGQWSQVINEQQRVFAMIGVTPRADDAGLPSRLALKSRGAGEEAPVQVAAATDLVDQARENLASTPVVAEVQPVQSAQSVEAEAPAPDSKALATTIPSTDASSAPLVRASGDPMRQAARVAFQRSSSNAQSFVDRADTRRHASVAAPASNAAASDWVIQLGAYDTAAIAQEKWQRIGRSRASLGAFHEVHSQIAVNGRIFHRLAIRGFGDRHAAWQTCQSLRAQGQSCFVRLDDTGSIGMARADTRKGPQVAGRKPRAGRQIAAR